MNIVITGSSSGIGRFLADTFEAGGHGVCRIARSPQSGFAFKCDVSSWAEVRDCAAQVSSKWNHVDGLVCCAGTQGPIGPAMQAEPERWCETVDVNLNGTYFSVRAFYDLLRRAPRRAKVIFFSGGGSTNARANFSAYAASKAAIVRLVETLAQEWRNDPIDINAVAPGAVNTAMTKEVLASGPGIAGATEFERASKQSADNGPALQKIFGLSDYLLSEKSDGISGKLISAVWDPWSTLHDHLQELVASDIYTLRRIVPEDRGKKWSQFPG